MKFRERFRQHTKSVSRRTQYSTLRHYWPTLCDSKQLPLCYEACIKSPLKSADILHLSLYTRILKKIPSDPKMTLPKSHAGLQQWLATNTYCHKDFPIPELASEVKRKGLIVTVIIPAREVAEYIGGVLEKTVEPLVAAHIITKVIAIDNYSVDGTGAVAAKHGATVLQRTDIAPELGKSLGKGDAMWRALLQTSMAEGSCDNEIIAFLDGDTGNPDPSHLIGIVGPLIYHDHLQMVKGSFDRPFKSKHGDTQPHQGGRVTEILARPLLNGHFPALSGFRQPLAGEFAARRGLLEQLDFPVGYGVEIGTLIDAFRLVGLQALAESDLGIRQSESLWVMSMQGGRY